MEWKKHKYYFKLEKPNYTRYFYTKESYRNFLNGKNKTSNFFNKTVNNISNKLGLSKNNIVKGKNFVDKYAKQKIGVIPLVLPTSWVLSAKKFVSNTISNITEKIERSVREKTHKYYKKEMTSDGKYRYFYSQKEYDNYINTKKQYSKYQENEKDFMKKIKEIKEPETIEETMKKINEDYPNEGYTENCMHCTVAYELRKRGYDVEATPNNKGGQFMEDAGKWFEGDNLEWITTSGYHYDADPKYVEKMMVEKSGKNTRGNLCVTWLSGGGHSMVYEIDNDGNVTILDCQTNTKMKLEDVTPYINKYYYMRTDNLELREGIFELVRERS